MKERIDELADKVYSWCVDNDGPSYGTIQSAITDAVNEALELAAKECEIKVKRPAGYNGAWEGYGEMQGGKTGTECAEAIRKLKV